MDVDPLEAARTDIPDSGQGPHGRLNAMVAVAVALIASFMAVCNVKDGNIVQAMQQAQADKIDLWDFYQARHIREEVMTATAAEMTALGDATAPGKRTAFDSVATRYREAAKAEDGKRAGVKTQAEAAQARYDELNYHDDQFDLAESLLSLAISLLAITSLTHRRWLFGLAMVPTLLGITMGLAGLFGWRLHSDLIARLLS